MKAMFGHFPHGFTILVEISTGPAESATPVARRLAFFAGIWTSWTSVRKGQEGETTNDLFGFLTCEPNSLVAQFHPKAMPVILTTRSEVEFWLSAPAEEALKLQRPLPDDALTVVARGEKQDTPSPTEAPLL
jgi:putative SOS response-associated peptidase YedK